MNGGITSHLMSKAIHYAENHGKGTGKARLCFANAKTPKTNNEKRLFVALFFAPPHSAALDTIRLLWYIYTHNSGVVLKQQQSFLTGQGTALNV